jgi:hypothetical protein
MVGKRDKILGNSGGWTAGSTGGGNKMDHDNGLFWVREGYIGSLEHCN